MTIRCLKSLPSQVKTVFEEEEIESYLSELTQHCRISLENPTLTTGISSFEEVGISHTYLLPRANGRRGV
ncbi:hypothetical protein MAR_004833 [Mya arenaria]|uniref:Uncharacterized protein n=1 Tax=Mya arenaria TaxID=6604 RepID=A0ABY7EXQ8_MYAAR|nr:hypothetical protein MAR_004833 [Mya arenaria]